MKLRTASTSDASSIAALSIEIWLGTYLRRGVSGFFADYALAEFTTAKIKALLSAPEEFVVVSENEEGIDGFIRVSTSSPGPVDGCCETEVSTLYVQPRHHGKGLGKALLATGLHHCRHNGAQSVWLATNSENTPAIDFYRSQGFTRVGHTHFRIQDRAYLNEVLSCRVTG